MQSFEHYFEEKFSLNPKNWFTSPEVKARIAEEDKKLRSNARKNAHIYIPKLKKLLKDKGYTVHKHGFSYTMRKDRKLGISPGDSSRERENYKEPLLNIPYIRTLFTLAHEVGHVLQWDDETDTREKFDEFLNQRANAEYLETQNLENLHKLWYELDAWIKGMQFIPVEYKRQYKQYA
ncbi:MAG: hypothetical protein HQK53_13510, partial [Oligoflexia bacterium]|nr:hypothetical protein [Oligoflexia bacterium]